MANGDTKPQGRPDQTPPVIPAELRVPLLLHHHDPYAFFAGQFKHYIMQRLNTETREYLEEAEFEIHTTASNLTADLEEIFVDYRRVVGVHIRRTDKVGSESMLYSVGEYMRWVDYWYRVQQRRLDRTRDHHHSSRTLIRRRVYVASDDPTVLDELRNGTWQSGEGSKAEYEFLANANGSNSAQLSERYTENSLRDTLVDIHMLTQCAHLVCTFSSTACRSVYELMLVQRVVDGTGRADSVGFHSLDFGYLYAWQRDRVVIAMEEHSPTAKAEDPPIQMNMVEGDLLVMDWYYWEVTSEHRAGWSRGTNKRTGQKSWYPNYKVTELWKVESFPIFAMRHTS